ncbi:MAG: hypothetical protein ACK44W_08180, partial [Planctomycetota bacterium]
MQTHRSGGLFPALREPLRRIGDFRCGTGRAPAGTAVRLLSAGRLGNLKPMKRLAAALLATALAGCAGSPPDPRPVALDPVCLCNGDLGCVRVRVDEKTPRA